jgi:hypothetical protein
VQTRTSVRVETKEHAMQFVALIYQGSTPMPGSPGWAEMTEAEQQAVYADYAAVTAEDAVTPGLPLGLPAKARTVQVTDGTVTGWDGPYLKDPAMAVGGSFVIEAADIDGAVAIAARVPAARLGGAVEVRPAETYW